MEQAPRFKSSELPNHVFKFHKAGLKQAPRAWYARLTKFILENDFRRGKIDKTFFIKTKGKDFLIIQVYMDDIIFFGTNNVLCQEFSNWMSKEFEMSIVGELNFFLGL